MSLFNGICIFNKRILRAFYNLIYIERSIMYECLVLIYLSREHTALQVRHYCLNQFHYVLVFSLRLNYASARVRCSGQ